MLLRRLITIPALLVTSVLFAFAFPFLFVTAVLAARLTSVRGATATLLFTGGYLVCQLIGITRMTWVWISGARRADFIARNQAVQYWWANALRDWVFTCFKLKFTATGIDALTGPPCMVFPRHASLADTVLPIVLYGSPLKLKLRYVLKRELLWDPALDIGGNRIPNHFVDRSGHDSEGATRAIRELTAGIGVNEGIAMFPEGTRFSAAKHNRLIKSNKPDLVKLAERWPDLLPPRLGGSLAMLNANPGLDLLFIAHAGFELAGELESLLSGEWLGTEIRVHYWRVPFADIPGPDGQKEFLFAQWDRMQRTVLSLRRGEACE